MSLSEEIRTKARALAEKYYERQEAKRKLDDCNLFIRLDGESLERRRSQREELESAYEHIAAEYEVLDDEFDLLNEGVGAKELPV